ncbi:unnamed protein product [Penicillium pancosmium]
MPAPVYPRSGAPGITTIIITTVLLLLAVFVLVVWAVVHHSRNEVRLAAIKFPEGARALREADAIDAAAKRPNGAVWVWFWAGKESALAAAEESARGDMMKAAEAVVRAYKK